MRDLNIDEVQDVSGGFLVMAASFFSGMQELSYHKTLMWGVIVDGAFGVAAGLLGGPVGVVVSGGFGVVTGLVEGFIGYTVGSLFAKDDKPNK